MSSVRIGRALSAGTYRLQGGSAESTPVKTKLLRQQSAGPLEVDCDGKVLDSFFFYNQVLIRSILHSRVQTVLRVRQKMIWEAQSFQNA